ncbi:MAG: hypothetical protein NC343_07415 [Muribaculum sp.]|nr:hypothetical protein [Muribaculaceae bacterium]MCM1081562.1 hypothetical protein [Muribaculum sp.]
MSLQQEHITEPQLAETATQRRRISIGFLSSAEAGELRFPITPEGAELLINYGFTIMIQEGAGAPIHYPDQRYIQAGAMISKRSETLHADIVVSMAQLQLADVALLRKGAMLLSLISQHSLSSEFVTSLLKRHVTFVALEKIVAPNGNRPFADVLLEIDGRAAMAVASAILLRPEYGKGILLGGIPGVIPCEIMIIGSGLGARAAATAAIGVGAQVRMFDNDVYGLRETTKQFGSAVATSVLQPHVVENALRSADVVIASPARGFNGFSAEQLSKAKKGVVLIDISPLNTAIFPSEKQMPVVNTRPSQIPGQRVCFRSIGNAAPRTAAMAMSNTLINSFAPLAKLDGNLSLVQTEPGIQAAVCTFMGKAVNVEFARAAGQRPIELNLLLSCS